MDGMLGSGCEPNRFGGLLGVPERREVSSSLISFFLFACGNDADGDAGIPVSSAAELSTGATLLLSVGAYAPSEGSCLKDSPKGAYGSLRVALNISY